MDIETRVVTVVIVTTVTGVIWRVVGDSMNGTATALSRLPGTRLARALALASVFSVVVIGSLAVSSEGPAWAAPLRRSSSCR